jgi:hypothetical protein
MTADKKNKEIYQIIKTVIDERDFMRLFKLHCPPDEYEPEISALCPLVTKRKHKKK